MNRHPQEVNPSAKLTFMIEKKLKKNIGSVKIKLKYEGKKERKKGLEKIYIL